MKKILFLFIFITSVSLTFAQVCVPDSNINEPGTYPDSATGLPDVTVGIPYELTVTVVVQKDTVVTYPPIINTPTAVEFDYIKIKNWNNASSLNIPPGLSGVCEPAGCVFPGNTKGCLFVSGTVTDTADAGDYLLYLDLEVKFKNVPFLGTYTLDDGTEDADINDDYHLLVKVVTGINPTINYDFSLAQNKPNPFSRNTIIPFTSDKAGIVTLSIYNMLGELVQTETASSVEGINNIFFSSKNLPEGIYSYSLNNGEKTVSKRMILLEK